MGDGEGESPSIEQVSVTLEHLGHFGIEARVMNTVWARA
jgi:hypothetical protein